MGVVGLAFFLFSKRKLYFLWGILFWGLVLFVVPMFYSSPQYVFDSYKEWVSILLVKDDVNELSFLSEYLFIRNGSKDHSCC